MKLKNRVQTAEAQAESAEEKMPEVNSADFGSS